MKRIIILAYGVVCYGAFLVTFLYAVGFVGNIAVPRSIDGERVSALWKAITINVGLLLVFALQHSLMARPSFKRWWMRFVPEPIERSTYVLFSSIALILLFWQWQPMGGVVWNVEHPGGRALLYALFASGWLMVLFTTFLINHFDLFGLRQVWLHFRGVPYATLKFKTPGPYRVVRHPLYIGWLTAFWATPTMSAAHLLFALGMTAYILKAIQYEERDLLVFHGREYAEYRRRVPMLIPKLRSRQLEEPATAPSASRVS